MTARHLISVAAATLLMSGGLAATAAPDGPGGAATVTTVASGLDSPRGLEFGPDGGLYVATVGNGPDDGADAALHALTDDEDVPSAVELVQAVEQSDVICVHVDEPGAPAHGH